MSRTLSRLTVLLSCLTALGLLASEVPAAEQESSEKPDYPPCSEGDIRHYTALRAAGAITVDGHLDETSWQLAQRSPRFVDLVSGGPTLFDTRAAVLWDDKHLYVGFWVEEPFVQGDLTERDSPIYNNNDVEVFIDGREAYYEFEINSLGTIYEVFIIWEEAYESGGYSKVPAFSLSNPKVKQWNGNHPRGRRVASFDWDLPGLKTAVHVDGTLNDDTDRDRGWTVELAFPWEGMRDFTRADQRSLPPDDGDVWRIDFSRFNQYKEAPPSSDSGGWAWSTHKVWNSHIPECFPYIHFSTTDVRNR